MKIKFFHIIITILLLRACSKHEEPNELIVETSSNQNIVVNQSALHPSTSSPYEFHDIAIKESIERYFNKAAYELTAEDYAELAQLHSFSFYAFNKNIATLNDLPELFPELRYVGTESAWLNEVHLSAEDCVILEEMQSLRAVDIYADGLPSLAFAERLPYVSIRYTERAYMSDENNLAEIGRAHV